MTASAGASGRVLALAGIAALTLAACAEEAGQSGTSTGADGVTRSVQIVERDVEAPEVFQLTDRGLWDGRPSLGGVWIAHSDVDDPERVIIRNESTGDFVIGALFRRERENPGPRLQVSSDAAAALGMIAGQPVEISVTALRRQEEPSPAAAPDVADPEAAPETAPETAIAAADAPDAPTEAPAAGTRTAAADPAAQPDAEPDAEPAQPRRRFSLFNRRSAEPEPATAGSGIETRPLDNITETAASALDAAEIRSATAAASTGVSEATAAAASTGARSVAAPAAPAPAPAASADTRTAAATPTAAAPAPATGSTLDRPYVQIGIFSVEENAERAAAMLRAENLGATIRREEHRGQPSWRVLAGPSASGDAQGRLMSAVRRLGFEDAYAVRR